MPKSTKSVKRRGKKYRPGLKNKAKAVLKKNKKKSESRAEIGYIKDAWDTGKTTRENMSAMGLAYNPNEVVPIKHTRRMYIDTVPLDGDVEMVDAQKDPAESKRYKKKPNPLAARVVPYLEQDAENFTKVEKDNAKKRVIKMLDRDVELCIYLIERYGDDYKAMSRDHKNLMQDTPKQLAKKIEQYKKSAFYKALSAPMDTTTA